MEKNNGRFRTGRGALIAVLMFALGIGISLSGAVFANIQKPPPANDLGVTRDPENPPPPDPTQIPDGPNKPSNPPGGP